MSELIGIEWRFPKFLNALQERMNEVNLFVAANLQTNRGLMFDTSNQGRTPWEPLKLRDGQPLSQRGALRQSFGPTNDGKKPKMNPGSIVKLGDDVVTIGTSIKYAIVHNEGAVIKPVKAKFLWIPLPSGKANSSNAPTPAAKKLRKAARKKKGEDGWRWVKTKEGALVVRAPSGKVFLLAKKATIPKRPMDEWNEADQQELEEALRNKLVEVLSIG